MFITLTEEREDEDEVLTTKQVAINLVHLIWFQPCDEDPEKTYLELRGADSMIVAESFNEIWCRIKEVTQ